jgi:hypothetical protein
VAKEPTNALQAKEGHAWLAVIDTQTKTVVALGLHPKESTDFSASNPSTPGEFRDNSEREFFLARAYQIDATQHSSWIRFLARQRASSPTYDLATNNCASWVINSAKLTGVTQFNTKVADPDQIIGQGQSINTYTPHNLAVFLANDKAPGTRKFGVGLDLKHGAYRTVIEWTLLEQLERDANRKRKEQKR